MKSPIQINPSVQNNVRLVSILNYLYGNYKMLDDFILQSYTQNA